MDAILSPDILFVFGIAVAVPYGLARWLVRASWLQASFAFAAWTFLLLLVFAPPGAPDEHIGWAMIFGLLLNWVAVPVTALLCRRTNMPDRLIARLQRWSGQ